MSDGWLAAPLSLDDHLVAIRAELDFLRTISGFSHLTVRGEALNNAIRRYETLWLPLLQAAEESDGKRMVPPIDVHWVWHCHMLSPVSYRNDCMKLVGKVLDHRVSQPTSGDIDYSVTKWQKAVRDEDYEVSADSTQQPRQSYIQRSSHDLSAACVRQASFYYNVSLPHYKDRGFIDNAVLRYKKFLYLRKTHPDHFIVPFYDVDLVWHTHQLHPVAYEADMTLYLGSLFNHDDTDTDRSPSSRLTASGNDTMKLWRAQFGEEFALTGTTYRGLSPVGHLTTTSPEQVSALLAREGSAYIDSITLDRPLVREPQLAVSAQQRLIAKLRPQNSRLVGTSSVSWSGRPLFVAPFRSTPGESLLLTVKTGASCQCFSKSRGTNHCTCPLLEFLPNDGGEVNKRQTFSVLRPMGSAEVRLEGYTCVQALSNNALLVLELGQFHNVAMSDPTEQLWGPTPVGPLPPGASNICLVATHRLSTPCIPNCSMPSLSVRVIHCLPLVMSAVQVFVGDAMVALAHLVGPDQIPDSSLPAIAEKGQCVTLDSGAGERALVIKNSRGDWGFVFGRWANMRKGEPATLGKSSVPGNPGNLQVRFVKLGESLETHTFDILPQKMFTFKIPGMIVSLALGQMRVHSGELAERVALAFAVAVLNVLCQPPPPGYIPARNHGEPGPVAAPTVNTSAVMRGSRQVLHYDSGRLPLVAAAGWLLPTPCNIYIVEQRRRIKQRNLLRGGGATTDEVAWGVVVRHNPGRRGSDGGVASGGRRSSGPSEDAVDGDQSETSGPDLNILAGHVDGCDAGGGCGGCVGGADHVGSSRGVDSDTPWCGCDACGSCDSCSSCSSIGSCCSS